MDGYVLRWVGRTDSNRLAIWFTARPPHHLGSSNTLANHKKRNIRSYVVFLGFGRPTRCRTEPPTV